MTRPGFAFRFRKWIRVLAAGRLLLFRVGSRYLKALSSRHEVRELQKEEMEMADQLLSYGDGGNWVGLVQVQVHVTVSWQVDFDTSSSSVEIHITGQTADQVAVTVRLVDRSEYKRRQSPPGIKITHRAFGRDRRLPITNRFQPT